jgi:hypothetical protein
VLVSGTAGLPRVALRLSAPRRCPRAHAAAGKEFIKVIEQTQPEFRDKVRVSMHVECGAGADATRRARRARATAARDAGTSCPRLARRSRRAAAGRPCDACLFPAAQGTSHAVAPGRAGPRQFLCYKQLKKFLKQLPDTSAGAAARAPLQRARRVRLPSVQLCLG